MTATLDASWSARDPAITLEILRKVHPVRASMSIANVSLQIPDLGRNKGASAVHHLLDTCSFRLDGKANNVRPLGGYTGPQRPKSKVDQVAQQPCNGRHHASRRRV